MFARAGSGTIIGVEAHSIMVESHRAKGLPSMTLIGLARGAARESVVRVRSAIKSCGIDLPNRSQVINLLPAEIPKEASALDLALAVSLLTAAKIFSPEVLIGRRFYGELALNGDLEPIRGAVLIADLARRMKEHEVVVPQSNAQEAAMIPGINVCGASNLEQVILHLKQEVILPSVTTKTTHTDNHTPCLSDVCGQKKAKRALEISAAGNHNLLFVGPPGSGKTMLARRLPGILPKPTSEESIEITRVYSAAGLLTGKTELITKRPFRAPHHTASEVALCGGGSIPRPGEITLAHLGVLFLDEFAEFSRRTLDSLREPLEEGSIHIARASMSLRFPARVLLVAAMNPCPCGYFDYWNHPSKQSHASKRTKCLCSFDQIQRYRTKISGPLMDRIDLHVPVDAVPYRDFAQKKTSEASSRVLERVICARHTQTKRFASDKTNACMTEEEMRTHTQLDKSAMSLLEKALDVHGLSTRAIGRVSKVARTIADLEGCTNIRTKHLKEALGFRLMDSTAF